MSAAYEPLSLKTESYSRYLQSGPGLASERSPMLSNTDQHTCARTPVCGSSIVSELKAEKNMADKTPGSGKPSA